MNEFTSPPQTNSYIIRGTLLEGFFTPESKGIILPPPPEKPLHCIAIQEKIAYSPRQLSERLKEARFQTLTDEDFKAIINKLGAIIKGRLDSWTPEEAYHEELLFEEVKKTLEDS